MLLIPVNSWFKSRGQLVFQTESENKQNIHADSFNFQVDISFILLLNNCTTNFVTNTFKSVILNKKRITRLNFCLPHTCKLPGRSYPPSGLSTTAVETRCGLTHCRSPPANQQPPYSVQHIAGPRCPIRIRLSKSKLQLYPVPSAALFRAYPSACIKDRYTK